MATVTKALVRTSAATSSATLYTVPSATTTVITNIAVANTAGTAGTFTLLLDDVDLQTTTAIAANSTVYIDLKQVLAAAKTIKGFASATTIDFHISGVEIS
jgi:polyisoprenoid-binding protein YceI